MTPEEAVSERILSIAAVTALVSTRVWQLKLPQQPVLPAVRIQQIGEDEPAHLRGIVNLYRSRIQVDVYEFERSAQDPYATVSTIAAAIHGDWHGADPPNGLSGWRGTAGGSPPTLEIVAVQRIDRMPMYEAEELRLVRMRQDYFVWWKNMT